MLQVDILPPYLKKLKRWYKVCFKELDIDEKFEFKIWGTAEAARAAAESYGQAIEDIHAPLKEMRRQQLCDRCKASSLKTTGSKAMLIARLVAAERVALPQPVSVESVEPLGQGPAACVVGKDITHLFSDLVHVPAPVDTKRADPETAKANIWIAGFIPERVAMQAAKSSDIVVSFLLGCLQQVKQKRQVTMIATMFTCRAVDKDENLIAWPNVSGHLQNELSSHADLSIVGWVRPDPTELGITDSDKKFLRSLQVCLPAVIGVLLTKDGRCGSCAI